jgi:hypothetical protein
MDNFEVTITIESEGTDEHRLGNVVVKRFASPQIFLDVASKKSKSAGCDNRMN